MLLSGFDWYHYGGGRPKPDLYGIWTVTTFTTDDATVTEQRNRWQRVIVENSDSFSYQQANGDIVTSPAVIDAHTITLPNNAPPATLAIDRIAPSRLRLSGHLGGRFVTMTLKRLDIDHLPLRRNRFHWVQNYPTETSP